MNRTATRIYRYLRYRKGFGVHSPFAFGLINKVIEEKKPYYIYEEIEQIISRYPFKEKHRKKYGRFLFRIVNFFHLRNVLQVGVSDGVRAMYLNAAAASMIVLEENRKKALEATRFNAEIKSLDIRTGSYLSMIDAVTGELGSLDLLFLNIQADADLTRAIFQKSLQYILPETVFIIDGIHKKRMKGVWKEICCHHEVCVTMDLYSLGLVFFNRKMQKKDYKIYF